MTRLLEGLRVEDASKILDIAQELGLPVTAAVRARQRKTVLLVSEGFVSDPQLPDFARVARVGRVLEHELEERVPVLERGGEEGESAEQPVERAELQQQRHQPSDGSGNPSIRDE